MTAVARPTRHNEELLDQALEDTFPASDPVALTAPKNRKPLPIKIPKPNIDDEALPPERPA